MTVACYLLITTVYGILSLQDVYETTYKPFDANNKNTGINPENQDIVGNDNVYVNPGGPLDLLHGYLLKENNIFFNKRLFSPALKINYELTKEKRNFRFTRNNTKDGVNKLVIADEAVSQYLSQYYEAVRTMYNVVNSDVNIQTTRDNSFYRFLTQKLNKEESFKLLAVMLLLTKGVELPLELKSITIKFDNKGAKLKKPTNIQVLVYNGGANVKSLFEIEIYNVIRREGKHGVGEENYRTLGEIVNLIRFFIDYGGANAKKMNSYALMWDDTPWILIHSYIFEFIQNLEDARLFFKVVNDLLAHTDNEENRKVWNVFFTRDSNEVKKYKPMHDALALVDNIIDGVGFPFSIHTPSPSNVVVRGYDRMKKKETTNTGLLFSDCCDITIYTLFCCLLYDPTTKAYKMNNMEKNNYTPLKDFRNFFTEVCQKPVRYTSQNLHQEWTHVVQDLVLKEKELLREKTGENNTIRYCRHMKRVSGKKKGVSGELKADILNVLKVVAKVSGMPSERLNELGDISEMVQNVNVEEEDVKKRIEEYATKVFNEISVIEIEVSIDGLDILNETNRRFIFDKDKRAQVLAEYEERCVYGKVEIGFKRKNNNDQSEIKDIVLFDFMERHAAAKVISGNDKIREDDRRNLEEFVENADRIGFVFGHIAKFRVQNFLNRRENNIIPPEILKQIEETTSDSERYILINESLRCYNLVTIHDKLYVVDCFSPYLDKMTRDGAEDENNTVSNQTDSYASNSKNGTTKGEVGKLNSRDPVVQLISNILGSVPLDVAETQYLFVQILASCNGKHESIFPQIHNDDMVVQPPTKSKTNNVFNPEFLSDFHKRSVPNMLTKLYSKVRLELGSSFLEEIFKSQPPYPIHYSIMVKNCILLKNAAGIEAAKRDFKIREDKMELGADINARFRAWLEIVIEAQYLEGLKVICNTWESIIKDEDITSILLFHRSIAEHNEIRWDVLKGKIPEEICAGEGRLETLLEICIYFTDNYAILDDLFKLIISRSIVSSFQSLINCLENIDRVLHGQLTSTIAIANTSVDSSSLERLYTQVDISIRQLENLNYFICSITNFVNTCDECDSKSGTVGLLMAINESVTAMIISYLKLQEKIKRNWLMMIAQQ
ncbi:hypothetical protein PAEPH01_1478 [Pancytospora epiphaga]|nr:hypothetical protein PAEPH01_1478 [Pancytospora epiphaga]